MKDHDIRWLLEAVEERLNTLRDKSAPEHARQRAFGLLITSGASDVGRLIEVAKQLWLERDRYAMALNELVEVKDLKDAEGKTPEYQERQPAAWAEARACVAADRARN